MRRVGQVVQKNLDAGVRKRFPDQTNDPFVVLEKLVRIIDDLFAVILFEQPRVLLLLGRLEFLSDVALFANENQLACGSVILVFQEVMHAEPEIVQIELAEIFARDRERIEIVLLEIASELAAPLLVFSPDKAGNEKNRGSDDRSDDV